MRIYILLLLFILSINTQARDFAGKWISAATSLSSKIDKVNTWIAFRKDIKLNNQPQTAVAQIAVDSKYWLWINGQIIVFEGGVKRGPTPKDTYYDEVDLAPFLRKGNNQIAILVWHFGKDGFSHKNSGKAGLLFNLESKSVNLISDDSWFSLVHPSYETADAPYPNFRLAESNIRFDANKDVINWQRANCEDVYSFKPAKIIGSAGCEPWNKLIKRPIPQWKDFGMKNFVSLQRFKGEKRDTIVAKLPYNLQMTPYMEIYNAKGNELISIYTDNTFAAGDVNLRAEYITKKGKQTYESLGWLNGHYVYFVVPSNLNIEVLKYRETGYNTEIEGLFYCDNKFINQFWNKALRTLYVNMRDTYFDCPDRERAQWWGDEVILMGETFYTCSTSSYALMQKGIKELIAWQKKDGGLFSPIPAGNYDSELPGQMLSAIGEYGFWNYYMNTGDEVTIAEVYSGVKKYLDLWTLDDTGLTNYRSGDWTWGDWGENKDMRLLFAGWHYLALEGARKMAQLLHKDIDVSYYTNLMNQLKVAYNKCWNGYAYRHPQYLENTDDRVQALAVISGIADIDKYEQISKLFITQMHASPYMEKYVMESLCMMGKTTQAMERMQKRFGPMVNNSQYTTLFEGWDIGKHGFGGGTINHAWSGGPLIVIARHICGISPLSPGYKVFKIKPDNSFLKKASITVPTIQGKIESSFDTTEKVFSMKISIPNRTKAIVSLPMYAGRQIYINSKKVEKMKEYMLSGGKYKIEIK